MTSARLQAVGNRRWELIGELDFETVPALWREFAPLLRAPGEAVLSLSRVQRANSAALAMLLEAREEARRHGCNLHIQAMPAGLRSLAQMSNLESLLESAGS